MFIPATSVDLAIGPTEDAQSLTGSTAATAANRRHFKLSRVNQAQLCSTNFIGVRLFTARHRRRAVFIPAS